ncbi:hypothetical protein THMIRHAM_16060 [Thiomicrorhabdus immobilis]|uniref:Uncharacterized protein n=1 Tax=Thiomicrorhabdus immobilis TaxID=2791037 RepID=A0ABN6CXJ6_9GAMM|nr:hypothetical protein [Thiomicrorhabdus immobilis]BCN93821.1 hypothetical protein THMIRHAM_16060 [Thiomicrorhabdus immobilis]
MNDMKFSADLFEQLGGTGWVTRPGYFENAAELNSNTDVGDGENNVVVEEHVINAVDNSNEFLQREDSLSADAVIQQTPGLTEPYLINDTVETEVAVSADVVNAVVVIGRGLETVWQNEDDIAWQLWQNIMTAFDWDESQVVFFDTELLVSEEMVFSTIEEVIDLGVEWILTMDDEHEIVEQLAEGVHTVSVPDFESMLADPYSKQSFYHSVIALN